LAAVPALPAGSGRDPEAARPADRRSWPRPRPALDGSPCAGWPAWCRRASIDRHIDIS